MPTREELYTALRNADKAGDAEGARKLAAYIQSLPAETAAPSKTKQQDEPGMLTSLVAGLGKGIGETALGAQSLVGKGLRSVGATSAGNWLVSDADAGRAKLAAELAPYKAANPLTTGAGEIGGNVIATLPVGGGLASGVRAAAPALVRAGASAPVLQRLASSVASGGFTTGAPAAATFAGRAANLGLRAAGGAATGGASVALLDPEHALSGAAIGAALPPALGVGGKVAVAGGRTLKGLVDPFTEAGRANIVGKALLRFADDPNAIAAATGGPSITGALPTAAEASADRGLARLQDSLRSVDPQFENAIANRLAANNAARVATLQGIARTPAEREAAVAAVEAQAKQLYGQAFEENVEVTPALQRLISRPSVQKAEVRAIQLAREQGTPFQARLEDMRPRSVYAGMRDLPESGFVVPDNPAPVYAGKRRLPDSIVEDVSQEVSPLTMNPQPVITPRRIPGDSVDMYIDLPTGVKNMSVPSGRAPTFVDIPPVESVPVRDMHTLKMGMDALLQDPTLGIAGREAAAVMVTRNKLLDLLPESYQVARQGHIQMNKPVNQMDIGNRLLQQYSSATQDLTNNPSLRAEAFNRALQDEGKLIKLATGVKGLNRLADVMEPQQIAAIQGVADELGRTAAVAKAGNGPGSGSLQRLSSQNILHGLIDGLGLPPAWGENVGLNTAAKPLDLVYRGIADPEIQKLLAKAVLDPETAAALVRQQATAGQSPLERLLQSQVLGRTTARIAPAAVSDR